jgi:hypothetical protein
MDAKIDYLSFTLPLNLSGAGHDGNAAAEINDRLRATGFEDFCDFLSREMPARRGGRGHYGAGYFWQTAHISIWWGGIANHVLVEIAGVGCQMLRDDASILSTLIAAQTRATRIDVAVDLPDAGKPLDFVSLRKKNRFASKASYESASGWTEYVGSMKASRFARVYLYAEPHPRAGVLRVEHVLRDEYAKATCSLILLQGLKEAVAQLGNTFGWQHPRWQPGITTDGKITAQRHDTHGSGTLRWLLKAVAPALIKAHKDGLIDVQAWMRQYVLSEIDNTDAE